MMQGMTNSNRINKNLQCFNSKSNVQATKARKSQFQPNPRKHKRTNLKKRKRKNDMPNKFKYRFEWIKILAPIYLNTNLGLDKSKLNKLVDIIYNIDC